MKNQALDPTLIAEVIDFLNLIRDVDDRYLLNICNAVLYGGQLSPAVKNWFDKKSWIHPHGTLRSEMQTALRAVLKVVGGQVRIASLDEVFESQD